MRDAGNAIKANSGALAQVAAAWSRCLTPGQLIKAAGSRDSFYGAISQSECLSQVRAVAKNAGYGHVTIGVSASLGVGIGGDVETGFAFDVAGQNAPVFYQTRGLTYFSFGGGKAIVLGLGKGPATVSNIAGDELSSSRTFTALKGGGAGASFSYQGQLQSVAVILTAGAKGEWGYSRTNTVARSTSRKMPAIASESRSGGYNNGSSDSYDPAPYVAPSERSTKLRLCNETDEEFIYAGFGFWDDGSAMGETGWSAKGWKKIGKGRCQTTTIPNYATGEAYGGDVYLFATANGAWWGRGAVAMCVLSPDANAPLRMANVDRGCVTDDPDLFDTATYEVRDIPSSQRTTFAFTGAPDFSPAPQQASLPAYSATLCNKTPAPVLYTGLGIEGPSRTYAHAWFEIARGECRTLDLANSDGTPMGSKIYAFATDRKRVWGGTNQVFCLRDPAQFGRLSDTQTNRCGQPSQFRAPTRLLGQLDLKPNLSMEFTGASTNAFVLNSDKTN
ncbi:DUF1036 domain-containing protein [Erythrobacter sp. YT30]|uniref:DUF1036 domain-containing protein n=1 Tax=Erythrobacter sp. YT30 TaxID=1735012 RepID=UPI0018D2523C|nr:DUF1036 domain-containing protein [Erythrobacter sp. YT30]